VAVLQLMVPVGRVLLLAGKGLQLLVPFGGQMLVLVGSGLWLLILVLGLLLVCGAL
jgi:hypothetical protein